MAETKTFNPKEPCPNCQTKEKFIKLSDVGVPKVGGGHIRRETWQCTVCRSVFNRNVGSGRQLTYKDVEKESGAE